MRKKISVLLLIFAFSTAIISCFNKNDNASSENKNEVKKENLEEQNLSTGGAASGDIFNLGKTQSKDESQNDKIDNLTMDEQKVLIENEKVAFGKIRSKLKINDNFETELETIYAHTNSENYLQLFLTDYSNLFVSKVEKITKVEIEKELIPPYYEEKNLDIKNLEII